jgi:hypothetical protein
MEKETVPFLKFHNPTRGVLIFAEMLKEIVNFMRENPEARYRVMIGSDSNGNGILDLVSVVAIHRVGNGGRYFWSRQKRDGIHNLRQKIYAEVEASLFLAEMFLPEFRKKLTATEAATELPFDFEIHVDVGENGATRDLIREVTGVVRGYGYEVYVKPEAAAAMSFADRHVRQ